MEVTISFPIIAVGTKRLTKFFTEFGRRHRDFLSKFYFLGILIGGFLSVTALIYLISSIYTVFSTGKSTVGIVLPGTTLPGTHIHFPLVTGLLVIFVILLVHEGSHALAAAAEGFKIKSFQLVLFLIIPGAGVEIDEKELEERKDLGPLKVFAAGSYANILAAAFFLILLTLIAKVSWLFIAPTGVEIINATNKNFTALPGEVILEIDNISIKTLDDVYRAIKDKNPGEVIEIKTNRSKYLVTLLNVSGKPMIGVYLKQKIKEKNFLAPAYLWLNRFFFFSYILNLGVGLVNMLPVFLLDGWHFWRKILKDGKLFKTLSSLSTFLLLFNLLFPPTRSLILSKIVIPNR